jgi:hypothetical protein
MQPMRLSLMCFLLAVLLVQPAIAGSYRLTDGSTATGEPVAYGETGLILRDNSGLPPRIPWARFSQESLKQLAEEAKTPKDRAFVEPFIEDYVREQELRKQIIVTAPTFQEEQDKVREVERKTQPSKGLFALFSSPLGLLLVVLAYAANVYAGFELAIFRGQTVGMGLGLGLIPVVGPLIFAFIPTKVPPPIMEEEDEPEPAPAEAAPADGSAAPAEGLPVPPMPPRKKKGEAPTITMGAGASNIGLAGTAGGVSAAAAAGAAPTAEAAAAKVASRVQTFEKGKFIFNRRFFETKMPGFFRAVPREEEKDLVLYIRAARGEFVGKRITSIDQAQLALQIFKGNVTADEMIPFMEIQEVRIQPLEA